MTAALLQEHAFMSLCCVLSALYILSAFGVTSLPSLKPKTAWSRCLSGAVLGSLILLLLLLPIAAFKVQSLKSDN